MVFVGVTLDVIVVSVGTLTKVKKTKPVDWNNTYQSGKFSLCEKLRISHPVELVKARAYVAA